MAQDRKAQSSLMEYLLLSFFILAVILILIAFLSFWQLTMLRMETQESENQKVMDVMKKLTVSPLLTKENSVFDSAKLMAAQSLGASGCNEMKKFFGDNWFMEVEILNPQPGWETDCTASSYPRCTTWSICTGKSEIQRQRPFPVNVYSRPEDRTYLAVLRAGVYT